MVKRFKLVKKLIIICALLLSACNNDNNVTPTQQIKQILTSIEEGIEQRSLSQVLDNFSDEYNDHEGRNKKKIKQLTQFQILKNQNIHIFTRIKSIDIEKNYASVELSIAMTAREVDLSIEKNRLKADTYKSSIVLKNESGKWKVISSSWKKGW